jgi:AhpD family alkylhydroperoxidase
MTTTHGARVEMRRDAPDLYRAQAAFDGAVRESALDTALYELVKIRASQLNGCAYCIDMHTRQARADGETERRLYAIAAWRESPLFSDRERAAFALTDALTLVAGDDGRLDRAYDEAAAHFGPEELTALLYGIASINTWNRLAVATHAVFEP